LWARIRCGEGRGIGRKIFFLILAVGLIGCKIWGLFAQSGLVAWRIVLRAPAANAGRRRRLASFPSRRGRWASSDRILSFDFAPHFCLHFLFAVRRQC